MSDNTLTLRDELAMQAPIDFAMALRVWGDNDVNLLDTSTRLAFMAVWAMVREEWADVVLEQRAEPKREPGQPLPPAAAELRLDRQIITLNWFDQRTCTWLKRSGVETLRQLLALSVYELEKINGIGARDGSGRLLDILDRLNREGLHLAPKAAAPADDLQIMGEEAIGT